MTPASQDAPVTNWTIIGALIVVMAVINGFAGEVTGLYRLAIADQFSLSEALSAQGAPAYLLPIFIMSPVAGWLVDRISSQLLMVAGTCAFVAANLAIWAAGGFEHILAATTVIGVAVALTIQVPTTVIALRFTNRPGLVLGLLSGAGALASALCPWFLKFAFGIVNWRAAAMAVAIAGLVIALPAALLVKRPKAQPAEKKIGSLREVISIDLTLFAATDMLYKFAIVAVFFTLMPTLRAQGISDELAASIYVGMAFAGIPGPFVLGWVADRLGAWKVMLFITTVSALSMCLLTSVDGTTGGISRAWIYVAIGGALMGAPVLQLVIRQTFGDQSLGTRLGLIAFLEAIPVSFAPVLMGGLADRTGGFTTGLFATALIVLVSPIPALVARIRRARIQQQVPVCV